MSGDLFAPRAISVVRVALPVPVDRLFDYAVPEPLATAAQPGCRVRVRAGGRVHTGVVVETGSDPLHEGRLLPIEAVLDEAPALSPGLIRAIRGEAEATLCPVGIAVAAALPAGSSPRTAQGTALTARGREALASGAARADVREVLEALADGELAIATLRRRVGAAADLLPALVADGLATQRTLVRGPAARATQVQLARLATGAVLDEALEGPLRRAPRQADVLRLVAREGPIDLRSVRAQMPGSASALRALEARGLLEVETRTPALAGGVIEEDTRPVELTAEQAAACAALSEAIAAGRATPFLLHGVTGSGKTEVYLRAVAEALSRGRQALVLVPEITLTHQILARLHARFGDQLAVLHSGLRPGERLGQWERLRAGETPIAVGARSALFAPTRDLGLIVIDEEHDSAYKNEEGFRYHARSLALRRAREDGCPLLMGSATPSLELRHASDHGGAVRLRLRHRIGGRPMPRVEIVDMGRERAAMPRGRKLILSAALRRALRETLGEGGQTILFLNRRGFSTQIACFDCQHVVRCKHCDIALTFHAAEDRLRCHYCDFQVAPPELCPSCGSSQVALLGIGTERLEEEVRVACPDARVARLDRDVASKRGATEEVLAGLRRGDFDVVVGTQMVAKGHDFPGVQLVGVVNADLGLHFPDFRASERTFQLLTQVAGRAGRGAVPGRVLLQAWETDHPAIRPVIDHDYERFYAEEIGHRKRLGYPPFGRLALVRVTATDEGLGRVAAERLARAARESGAPCEVLGPAPSPIARLRGRYRYQVLLRAVTPQPVTEAARQVQAAMAGLPGDARATVDLAPVDML